MLGKIKLSLIEKLNLLQNALNNEKYSIKPNYISNWFARPYLDNEDFAATYQVDVYKHARDLLKNNKLTSVIDVGCGHALKLKKYIHPHTEGITGVDTQHSIEYCKNKYDFGTWIVDDITKPYFSFKKKYDIIMSVDVIEHLPDPKKLISYLKKLSHKNSIIIISTPERDLVRGKKHLGPPDNPAHVREWNKSELAEFLTSEGLKIDEHLILKSKSSKKEKNPKNTCQVVIGSFN